MKKLILILLTLLITFYSSSEVYYIIKVKGKIVNLNTGKELLQGMRIEASDKLEFTNNKAMALVISSKRGRFTLKLPPKNENEVKNELIVFVNSAIFPIVTKTRLGTRSSGFSTKVYNLKEYFGDENFTIIGKELKLKIDRSKYALSKNNYIVFKYTHNNKSEENIIDCKKQVLTINKEKLLVGNNKSVHSNSINKINLVLYKKITDNEKKITKFKLIFITKNELKTEFTTLNNILKKQKQSIVKRKQYMIDYFADIYGKTNMIELVKLIDEIIGS